MRGNGFMKNRVFMVILSFVLVLYVLVIIYGKSSVKKVDYQSFMSEKTYGFLSSIYSSNNDYEGMNYEDMYNLKDFFLDDKISSLNDLEKYSDYILIIEVNNEPIIRGNGIINNCLIVNVIKGNDLKSGNNILIHDLIVSHQNQTALYLDGSTPLKINGKYVVFLKKTNNSNINNSYVFSSTNFGHIKIDQKGNILKNYEQNALKLNEIVNYDHVFSKKTNLDEIVKYQNIQTSIWEKYHTY